MNDGEDKDQFEPYAAHGNSHYKNKPVNDVNTNNRYLLRELYTIGYINTV